MTKFQNPSFNSPANNEKYSDNYDRIFGARCAKPTCSRRPLTNKTMCRKHLEEEGEVEAEKPETD